MPILPGRGQGGGVPSEALQPGGNLERFILDVMQRSPLAKLLRQRRGLRGIVDVATATVASPGSVTVAWTTVDCSALLPEEAGYAVLLVTIGGVVVSSAAFKSNSVDFRSGPTAHIIATVGVSFANPTASGIGLQVTQQVIVPLVNRTFQYQKTDAINSSSGAPISLAGYIAAG